MSIYKRKVLHSNLCPLWVMWPVWLVLFWEYGKIESTMHFVYRLLSINGLKRRIQIKMETIFNFFQTEQNWPWWESFRRNVITNWGHFYILCVLPRCFSSSIIINFPCLPCVGKYSISAQRSLSIFNVIFVLSFFAHDANNISLR